MLRHLLTGFQLIHAIVAVLAAIGFFIFWARTRFWLPRYAHVLAAIALAVSLWVFSTTTPDAPISKQGPLAKLLWTLLLPAMVYFFFVFYGGQAAAYNHPSKPTAGLPGSPGIERFLDDKFPPHEPQMRRFAGSPDVSTGVE